MTVALPNSNHPKLAQKSQNYSENFRKFVSSSVALEQAGRNMTIRVPESSQFPSSSLAEDGHHTQHLHHHSNPHHNPIQKRRWALGTMLMFVLFVLSSSTSSVACIPIGSTGRLEFTSIPQEQTEQVGGQSGSVSSSSGGIEVGGGGDFQRNYMIKPQGQIYLPSLLQQTSELDQGIDFTGDRQGDGDSDRGRFGQQQPQDQARYSSQPLQKQHQISQVRKSWSIFTIFQYSDICPHAKNIIDDFCTIPHEFRLADDDIA